GHRATVNVAAGTYDGCNAPANEKFTSGQIEFDGADYHTTFIDTLNSGYGFNLSGYSGLGRFAIAGFTIILRTTGSPAGFSQAFSASGPCVAACGGGGSFTNDDIVIDYTSADVAAIGFTIGVDVVGFLENVTYKNGNGLFLGYGANASLFSNFQIDGPITF